MDALEQLTTVVLPKLVDKIREQKESLALANAAIAQDKEILNDHAKRIGSHEETLKTTLQYVEDHIEAIRKLYDALKQYKTRIEALEEKLNAQPAPEVKVRATIFSPPTMRSLPRRVAPVKQYCSCPT